MRSRRAGAMGRVAKLSSSHSSMGGAPSSRTQAASMLSALVPLMRPTPIIYFTPGARVQVSAWSMAETSSSTMPLRLTPRVRFSRPL